MLATTLLTILLCGPAQLAATYDLVIRGGRIIDGTGAPWYTADLGIRDGKIIRIGRIGPDATATQTIDAAGLYVAPGFIDMMGQTATPMLRDPQTAINLLTQGITTINAGEGVSAAPLGPDEAASEGWSTMAEYFQLIEQNGLPVNVAQTVGHTQVRQIVLGEVDRRPTEAELQRMRDLVDEAMRAGAIGVSTALIYPPATYASTEEIAALCEVAGRSGGRYYTHMRNEGDRLLDAIDEALEIGRQGHTPVHIFHLKAAGRLNWPSLDEALARIRAARGRGEQVAADIYPYLNNGLGLPALVHPRHFTEGQARFLNQLDDEAVRQQIRLEMETTSGWENWFRHAGHDWDKIIVGRTTDKSFRDLPGLSVRSLADKSGRDAWDVFFQLLRSDTFVLPQTMQEANLIKAMREPFVSFCTDVGPADDKGLAGHPRAAGSFPRVMSRFVRDLGVISLERAVAQASALAANEILAYDRGRISEGLAADIVVFDFDQLADRSTFAEPLKLAEGIRQVAVNGVVVLSDGKLTGRRPGRVLRGPGYDERSAPCHIATGPSEPKLAALDRLMADFIAERHIPGAALAVTNRGQLAYSRGFGCSDITTRAPVQPDSLFRIASLSKPVTAVAILQLVEQQKFKLDDAVLPLLKETAFLAEGAQADPRLQQITIRHLLTHSGGWDRDKSFDAMFQATEFARLLGVDAPARPTDVIRVMLGKPLDFDPGTRYAYSNLGYCMLGRVIENATGEEYEEYVKSRVLAPLGITRMRLGRTRRDNRAPDEVVYYDPDVEPSVFQADLGRQVASAYGGWNLEAMDAHGAWLASAPDLVAFASAFDDPAHCPLLTADSIATMFARPAGVAYESSDQTFFYSLGWMRRQLPDGRDIESHTGSLPGTATMLVRRSDGKDWAVLFNARSGPDGVHLGRALDSRLQAVLDSVTDWPSSGAEHQ